jgi:hypothetical protein
MVAGTKPKLYTLQPDEKSTVVMVYTDSYLYWGEVITKERIRVSTWFRTNAAPDNLCIYNGMALLPGSPGPLKPINYPEVHIPMEKVIAFHMVPPAADPPDYDTSELNRKMENVVALVGQFRMDGKLRMASHMTLEKYFEVARETFTGLYDVLISHPSMSQFSLPKVPFVLLRLTSTVIALKSMVTETI